MKTYSLRNLLVLIGLLAVQTGCNTIVNNDKYAAVRELNHTAEEYQKQDNMDQAIVYYLKGLSELRKMEPQVDSGKEKTFIRGMLSIQAALAAAYSVKLDTNNAILYATQSLKWAPLDTMPKMCIQDEEVLAINLLKYGNSQRGGTTEQYTTYGQVRKYALLIGHEIDSLCPYDNSDGLTKECGSAGYLFKEMGDMSRSDFYTTKYKLRYHDKYGHDPVEL